MAELMTADAPADTSAELHIHAEALNAAHMAATEQCTREWTSDNLRSVATVGRQLAEVYRELARDFCESAVLFHALCRARDHLTAEAQQYDEWANEKQTRTAYEVTRHEHR